MNSDDLYRDISRYLMGEEVDFSIYEPDLSDLTEFEQAVLNETKESLMARPSLIPNSQTASAVAEVQGLWGRHCPKIRILL